jgi:hypothetical protein
MKVCAHINYGPFTNGHKMFPSIKAATEYFYDEVVKSPYIAGTTDESDGCYVMYLYRPFDQFASDQPCQCDNATNYHDYPFAAYSVGPRYGLRKDII